MHVLNDRGQGRTCLQALSTGETIETYKESFRVLREHQPEAFQKFKDTGTLVSDLAPAPCSGFEAVEGQKVKYWAICLWHLRQAVKRNLTGDENESQRASIWSMILETDIDELNTKLLYHKRAYGGPNAYFYKNYGPEGQWPPKLWSRAFNNGMVSTTMRAEVRGHH